MPSNRTEQTLARLADLTPRKIVAELDRYIVGQADAKKAIAIALRNRWRRQRTPEAIREEIAPNNIILIGPTGVGKTEIARRLAKLAGAPFIKVEASKFTEVGYVGRDVESMVRDLVESAIDMVRHERETEVEDLANDRVDDRILDLLLPPPTEAQAAQIGESDRVFVASSQGSVIQEAEAARERHKRTRDKLKQLLLDGQLEQREIEIEVTQQSPQLIDLMSQQGAGEGMGNLGEMLSELMPKKKKKRTVTVADARRILLDEEFDKLINIDDVVTDALERVEKLGIIFLDEIDKIAGDRGEIGGPDVSREGVQRDLLPIVEGSQRADEVRHGEDRSHPVHRRRRVPRDQAERPDPGAAGPLPHPGGAEAAHRGRFRAHHDRAGERAHQAVCGAGRGRGRGARLHATDGDRRDRAHGRAW